MDMAVLIAGAGPVGLSLACELERHGVEHRIVDAAPERAAVSWATDLHARSLELWDHTGVAEEILDRASITKRNEDRQGRLPGARA